MSERKSWDIQPKRKAAPAPAPQSKPAAPTRPAQPVRRSLEPMVRRSALQKVSRKGAAPRPAPEPEPVKTAVIRRTRVPQGKDREPLKDRRKRARRTARTFLTVFSLLVVIAAIAALWLPAVRIQTVHASGPNDAEVQSVAENTLKGTYYFIIPRDSIFFFPEKDIRHAVLTQYPSIAAVSIFRTSFESIALASISREASFLWCGATPNTAGPALVDLNASTTSATLLPSCYDTDSLGYVFAEAHPSGSDSFRIYDDVDVSNGSPLGSRIKNASALPNALQFVKVIKSLGVAVTSLALRSDEADLYTQGGTKITYVLGKEDAAAKLAEAAFPTMSLNDGSLEYVDLRFTDKVYFKKKGETATATSTSR